MDRMRGCSIEDVPAVFRALTTTTPMSIEFSCQACGKVLRTADDKAGARAKCPECGETVMVPSTGGDPGDPYDLGTPASEAGPTDVFSQTFGSSPRSQSLVEPEMKTCPMCGELIRAKAIKCRFCGEMVQSPGMPGAAVHPHERVEYAGFWLRFVAWFIDIILLTIVNIIIRVLFGLPPIDNDPFGPAPPAQPVLTFLVAIISFIVQWLYFACFEISSSQGTLGKMALGLKVTDESGEPISFGRATGRHFGKLLSGLILLIGYIMAGFTEKKQALHDMMAGCLVIKKP